MSEEPLEFDPLGRIIIRLDDSVHTLGRPNMGQWRWFKRQHEEAQAEARADLEDLHKRLNRLTEGVPEPRDNSNPAYLEVVNSDEYRELVKDLEAAAVKARENPMFERTLPWIAEVASQLADLPLPDDREEWPAWLSNPSLPAQFLKHWQTVPKASGPTNPTP